MPLVDRKSVVRSHPELLALRGFHDAFRGVGVFGAGVVRFDSRIVNVVRKNEARMELVVRDEDGRNALSRLAVAQSRFPRRGGERTLVTCGGQEQLTRTARTWLDSKRQAPFDRQLWQGPQRLWFRTEKT